MTIEDQVKAAIAVYCQIRLTSVAVTAYIDGGVEELIVDDGPIISITSITDTSDDSTTSSDDYDFYPTQGAIFLKSNVIDGLNLRGLWGSGKRRWKVIYAAGFSSLPDDLDLAVDLWTAEITASSQGSMTSESIGDYSYTKDLINGMPSTVRTLLDRYRRYTGFR